MNSQQVAFLNKLVERYLNTKYPKIHNTISISDKEYLELFDANTIDTGDIFQANFILPDGRLKKFQLNLAEFKIPDIYTINFKVSNENIVQVIRRPLPNNDDATVTSTIKGIGKGKATIDYKIETTDGEIITFTANITVK